MPDPAPGATDAVAAHDRPGAPQERPRDVLLEPPLQLAFDPALEPLFVIEDAAILGPTAPIIHSLDLVIPDRVIAVLLGPGGAGKSTLLHALSGRRLPGDLRLDGTWRYRGLPRSRWSHQDIFLLPQRRAGAAGGTWRDALEVDAPVLLLDEPCASLPAAELDELAARLIDERARRTIVVATHHLGFARRVASFVALLTGGQLDCAGPADRFFASPPTPMAQQIIAQGNCWPRSELPGTFKWVSPQLAGMGRPGLGRSVDRDLAALAAAGVELVVSLTEDALAPDALAQHGLDGLHFPVEDMGVPRLADTRALCDLIARRLAGGGRVVFHCHAGLGRTGTLLATQLVHAGRTAPDAIRAVRAAIRNAIQTPEQEAFVAAYADAQRTAPSRHPHAHPEVTP